MHNNYTGLFKNKDEEDLFFSRFVAMVEEWGLENIVVHLPESWRDLFSGYSAGVRLVFTTSTHIKAVAAYGCARLEHCGSLVEPGAGSELVPTISTVYQVSHRTNSPWVL